MASSKPVIYCVMAATNVERQQVAGVAMAEDGEILGGVVVPMGGDLAGSMGIGTNELHDLYIKKYGIDGYRLEFSWEPDKCAGFQRAQAKLLERNPDCKYDPWNPRPFWGKYHDAKY